MCQLAVYQPPIHFREGKEQVYDVFLGGWPARDPACQNCIDTSGTWKKKKMWVPSFCYVIKYKKQIRTRVREA